MTRHVSKRQPCSPESSQTLTRKPPLGAWAEGRAPDHLLKPLLGDSFDSGIRGPGSGANSICLGSIQTVRGSVLPDITNFLNKKPSGGSARPTGDARAQGHSHSLLLPRDPHSTLGRRWGNRGWEPAVAEPPSGRAVRGSQLSVGGRGRTMHPGQAGGGSRSSQWTKAGSPGPAGARSARQRLFHLNPPWTGQNNPSPGHCWAVTT